MRRKIIVITIFLIAIIPLVNADDISMSVDQTTYYFLTGQQAIIPLTVNNTYNKNIDGKIKYTITQHINQGGFIYTSSNSQSTSFNLEEGNHTVNLNFGSSNNPVTLNIDLIFSYDEKGKREVSLNDITIIFVSNQSQMNNEKNRMKSSSEEVKDAQPDNQNQNQPQTPQQKLQNNQMSQDSQALKEQMEKQIKEQESKEKEFEENLFNNSEFQENHQDLKEQGYNVKEMDINPETNDTGDFEIKYQNEKGEEATMSGSMENGEIENLQKQTAEDRRQMLESLNQSEKYQDFLEQLEEEGFNQTAINFNQNGNITNLEISYENEKNETVTIKAEFEDNELIEVSLEKEEQRNQLIWILMIITFIFSIILYILLKKYMRETKEFEPDSISYKKSFNYKIEADKLLKEAERLFKKKKYKDAYGKAGQALRLYLSYENGLKKEMTNDDVIKYLKHKNKSYKDIKKCFDLCSLVEFAKYKENKKDFDEILKITGKTITS
jgi:hypothetical protein